MEFDLAAQAALQAAPQTTGAENERERSKTTLLERMRELLGGRAGEPEPSAGGGEEAPMLAAQGAQEQEPREQEPREHMDAAERAAARREAHIALAREFPEALAEGSELAEACREELAYLREARSPLAEDPQAEYKVARRMARLLGLAPTAAGEAAGRAAAFPHAAAEAAAGSAVANAAAGGLPPRRSARPLPAGGAPVEPPATTLERRVAGAKSTHEMLSLMREIGTPFEALLRR